MKEDILKYRMRWCSKLIQHFGIKKTCPAFESTFQLANKMFFIFMLTRTIFCLCKYYRWLATINTKDGRRIVCVLPNEDAQSKISELPLMNKLSLFAYKFGASASDCGWSMYNAEEEYQVMGIGTSKSF